jgi:hypothetical protein
MDLIFFIFLALPENNRPDEKKIYEQPFFSKAPGSSQGGLGVCVPIFDFLGVR